MCCSALVYRLHLSLMNLTSGSSVLRSRRGLRLLLWPAINWYCLLSNDQYVTYCQCWLSFLVTVVKSLRLGLHFSSLVILVTQHCFTMKNLCMRMRMRCKFIWWKKFLGWIWYYGHSVSHLSYVKPPWILLNLKERHDSCLCFWVSVSLHCLWGFPSKMYSTKMLL